MNVEETEFVAAAFHVLQSVAITHESGHSTSFETLINGLWLLTEVFNKDMSENKVSEHWIIILYYPYLK